LVLDVGSVSAELLQAAAKATEASMMNATARRFVVWECIVGSSFEKPPIYCRK
jgi:hypothetical protein